MSASPREPSKTPNPLPEVARDERWLIAHREEYQAKLLKEIKKQLPELEKLLAQVEDHWGLEDGVYRFYHGSFKVYGVQGITVAIRDALQALLPDRPLNG